LELFKLDLFISFSSAKKSAGFGDTLCSGIICEKAFSCLSIDVLIFSFFDLTCESS
jgi:hypothetical protein